VAGVVTKHPFHIVDPSPWPLAGSVGRLCLVAGLAAYAHKYDASLLWAGLALVLATVFQ